jgi:bacterioferritin-associated ferredoxin
MMAGAAQSLLKAAAEIPAGRTVLAGSGPLLWLLAWQYLKAGVPIEALLDTTPRGRLVQALPHAMRFARSDYLAKGLNLLREVRKHVRVIERVSALAAEGDVQLASVRYEAGGRSTTLAADLLLLHQGVAANINLTNAIGCEHRWNEAQASFEPVTDVWGGTSVEGVYIAGDGGGVAGAQAAEASGRLTALAVANALGKINGRTRDIAAVKPSQALVRALRGRRFLETLYRPADTFRIPSGDTIVCRCEEVTAQQIIDTVAIGCSGPNQMKSFLRCGMGPCQGRFCGLTVTELIARERDVSPAQVGYYRLRFPVKPVTLGELAELPADAAAVRAVDRVGTH